MHTISALPTRNLQSGRFEAEVRGLYVTSTGVALAWATEALEQLGCEMLHAKYDFKVREGFDLAQVRLPQRIFETSAPVGPFDEADMRQALAHYAEQVRRRVEDRRRTEAEGRDGPRMRQHV